jgi:hypothetical protein
MCIINEEMISMLEGRETAEKQAKKDAETEFEAAEKDEDVLKHINTKYSL